MAYKRPDELTGVQQPQDVQPMDWNTMMQNYAQQIENRPKFQYDLNTDALYQQYKDQYTKMGRQAMEDTMGQAAGLTGGYGSSYGQAVGNQAYNDYLTKLNAEIPGLYAQARAGYDADTQDLYNKYNLALQGSNLEYERGRDALADQRYEQEYNDKMAYQAWQQQQTEQGNARDMALMMIKMGMTPNADLLNAAGISAADASAMARWYAGQLAGTGSGGSSRSSSNRTPKVYDYDYDAARQKQLQQQATAAGANVADAASSSAYDLARGTMDLMLGRGQNKNLPKAGDNVRENLFKVAYNNGKDAFLDYYYKNIDGKYANAADLYRWVMEQMGSMPNKGRPGGRGNNTNVIMST